jgi:hypothetical protein
MSTFSDSHQVAMMVLADPAWREACALSIRIPPDD